MQYNLVHRGAVIKTFDTSAMDPDEVREMKYLGGGHYFQLQRAEPDQLPALPDNYSMLAQAADEMSRTGNGPSWRRPRSNATQ